MGGIGRGAESVGRAKVAIEQKVVLVFIAEAIHDVFPCAVVLISDGFIVVSRDFGAIFADF